MSTGTSQCHVCGGVYDDINPCKCELDAEFEKIAGIISTRQDQQPDSVSAPREYWLAGYPNERDVGVWYDYEPHPDLEVIHVIEYSAYQSLVDKKQKLEAENEQLNTRRYELLDSANKWASRAVVAEQELDQLSDMIKGNE